jgi:hypothetical protein
MSDDNMDLVEFSFDDTETAPVGVVKSTPRAANGKRVSAATLAKGLGSKLLAHQTDAVVAALAFDCDIYCTDAGLVHVSGGKIRAVSVDNLQDRVSRIAGVTPTTKAAQSCLARHEWGNLRELKGLSDCSIIYPDGRIISAGGYDEASGVLYSNEGCYANIPDSVTKEDAKKAADWLFDEFLCDVAFATDDDRVAGLAGLMTAVLRPAMSIAPIFHVSAGSPQTGKSVLSEICIAAATGTRPFASTYKDDDEALQKELISLGLSGARYVYFDNITRHFHSGALCAAVTSGAIADRILGRSEIVFVPMNAVIITNGNNVMPIQDTLTRAFICRLDANLEDMNSRVFKRSNPVEDGRVFENRAAIIAAVIAIAKAWMCAGREVFPNGSRFADWNTLVRNPLMWLGLGDPLASAITAKSINPAEDRERVMFTALWSAFGDAPFKIKDVTDNSVLTNYLRGVSGNDGMDKSRVVQTWVGNRITQIHGGLKLDHATKKDNTLRYKVRYVGGDTPPDRDLSLAKKEFFPPDHPANMHEQ